MALSFNQQNGSAKKNDLNLYKYVDGDNSFRIVGDILPRYNYWVTAPDKKQLPFECLAFDRDSEAFLRKEKDWVREFFPDLKCSWAYATQCLVEGDEGPELKVLPLKKKLWEQIITAAEDLGDPTDPDTGWDISFKRVKTGPKAYNVEYQLQVAKIVKAGSRPLTEEERELIKDLKSTEAIFPRDTPDQQRQKLEAMMQGGPKSTSSEDEAELDKEFDIE